MRRAISILVSLILSLSGWFVLKAHSAPMQITGVGLIDYANPPDFKVGDWVRYHITGRSELGAEDDYTVTLLIAGEYDFWGDRCFWLETWKEAPGVPMEVATNAVSYTVFADPEAIRRIQFYTRVTLTTNTLDGQLRFDVIKPAASAMKLRREIKQPNVIIRDTLGTDTCSTPVGEYRALKVHQREGVGATQSVGDSSVYQENRENRTGFYSKAIPITHLVREEVESVSARKSWLIGRSGDASPLAIRDRALGTARLIAMGHGDLPANMVPEQYRYTVAEQRAREAASNGATKTSKPKSKR